MKKHLTVLVLLLFCAAYTHAQDTIVTRTEKITCKVEKISDREIEYKKWNNLEGPAYVILRGSVLYIRFHNGVIEQVNAQDKTMYSETGRHAIKFDFFSPATHKITLGYEYNLNRNINFEFYSSVISNRIFPRGTNAYYEPEKLQGVGFRASSKFRLGNLSENVHSAFNTWFIRVDLLYSRLALSNITYSTNSYDPYYGYIYDYKVGHIDLNQYGMCINIGFQCLVGRHFTFQMNGGVGYLVNSGSFQGSHAPDPNKHYYHYYDNDYSIFRPFGNALSIDNTPLCVTGNFTLGYILGKTKMKKK